jgi:RNA polymerase sigma-70 factor (ECF subfamily)
MKIKFADSSDTQLILSFQNGNANAFDVLIERHKDKIYSSIYFLVKDKYLAEDIFQDTFIRIIDTLRNKKYNEEGKFILWAMRIAHNLCVDHFRRIKRMPPPITSDQKNITQLFETLGINDENAEQKIIKRQTYNKVEDMLNRLPDDQREVIVLRHYADMSFKEIASLTNCSINTALGRMRYGLINLRKIVAEHQLVL